MKLLLLIAGVLIGLLLARHRKPAWPEPHHLAARISDRKRGHPRGDYLEATPQWR